MGSKKEYETGSGNVFKDLGIPNAEEHLVKAQLVIKIDTIMRQRRLKQAAAADLLGTKRRMFPRCCAESFDSSRLNVSCAFLWPSIRTLKSL